MMTGLQQMPSDAKAVLNESMHGQESLCLSRRFNPNRKIFEARKRETAALGAGEKLVLGHPCVFRGIVNADSSRR